ncbi:MAG: hypothetical protein OJF50_006591 [Nitrospira sp.]|nr:hypothetical protein [Nitrospira sp.]
MTQRAASPHDLKRLPRRIRCTVSLALIIRDHGLIPGM